MIGRKAAPATCTPALYASLQPQPRQFDFFGKADNPKIHELVLAAQRVALDHLMHAVVLKRLTDTRLCGNRGERA